jgi:soluble lytic murein transglycosylase-like protein
MEALILAIALEVGVPPYLALSIALTENQTLNPLAVHKNRDGSFDLGIMQLNSGWYTGNWQDPEENIRAGCLLLKELLSKPGLNTWQAVICYNAGYQRFCNGPPMESVEYAGKVFERWNIYRRYRW